MNKHTKMAILTAPFLAIGGYVASGYFLEKTVQAPRLLTLIQEAPCNMLDTPCVLKATGLTFQISDSGGNTEVTSSVGMASITIAFVDKDGTESAYPLLAAEGPRTWTATTNYSQMRSISGAEVTVRLAAKIENLTYIHEFKPGL